ncbi:galactoside 2-alpha-L-fucosyltransferase-like [Typha latifolia]|uniref:galactoside 2-alpha-L-fucosyltransferase-like n=1 Tax=Typha latifolia TaxID=4733 RepID=UPI003C2D3900
MDREMEDINLEEAKKKGGCLGTRRARLMLLVFVLSLPLFYIFYVDGWDPSELWFDEDSEIEGYEADFFTPNFTLIKRDKLLGGLLLPGFDEQSCLSRYQSAYFRKESPFLPSSHLVSRLRQYESLHKKCGPNTPLYKKSIQQLKSKHSASNLECNYVVWTPLYGMGNRILTIASAFLYALLTNKVLLIHLPPELVDLFCEPFPNTSWVLPSDFPLIKDLAGLRLGSRVSYGRMLKNKVINNSLNVSAEMLPSYVYVHLVDDYKHLDGLFFCEDDQLLLDKVNWIIVKSDVYFVPQFFLIEQYIDELQRLFPAKETVFHHLGRYLFHPTNHIWRMVTRFYYSHLTQAEETIALQIRYMPKTSELFENLFNQVMSCSLREKLLPNINTTQEQFASSTAANGGKRKAILVISLYAKYYEKIKSIYYNHPTTTGEVIRVYQPTHEEEQQTEHQSHNQKAVADLYLLSMCDVLVTSPWSTFGYIGQSLAGLKPWILFNQDLEKVADPPCVRAMSMEPCFHNPTNFDCKARKGVDSGALVKYVRHCEEAFRGVKLVD